jgi:nitrate/nitrite-specific signal transduction histidine kinase
MTKLTLKIALPIIITGIFIITAVIAIIYDQLNIGLYVIIALLLVYTIFYSIAVSRRVTTPVSKILKEAKELNRGNLSDRVYLETRDELSELAQVLNEIAEKLEIDRKERYDIEKALGIKVKVKTQEFQEIIDALEQKVRNRTVELEKLVKETERLQNEIKELKNK